MKILGLDIGTTTVSAVVMEAGQVLFSLTRPNDSFLVAGAGKSCKTRRPSERRLSQPWTPCLTCFRILRELA